MEKKTPSKVATPMLLPLSGLDKKEYTQLFNSEEFVCVASL